MLQAFINFRQDFTHVLIGCVTSHFCCVFFDQWRDILKFIGNK